MRFFILNQEKQVLEIDNYIKENDNNSDFVNFIRREALDEEPSSQSDEKPVYLKYANAFGFSWDNNADIGHVQYNYKANLMRRLVQDYARSIVNSLGMPVYEVNGANMFQMQYPIVSAYASLYGDRLYKLDAGKSDLVMSYDGSYPQFNIAAKSQLSYKHLPFAHFSIADCYRKEQSGEMMLLMRQRRFFMPDVHPYFKDIDEAFEWFPKIQDKIIEAGNVNGRQYQVVVEIPSEKVWLEYRSYIEQIPISLGHDVLVNILNDNNDRYWVVNVDYKIIDKLGQAREIACIQVDIGNARRLDINYIDEDGHKKNPVIIHSAIPGGIERYLYSAFDIFEQGLPLWLNPIQIRLIPVGHDYVKYCKNLIAQCKNLLLRIDIDDRNIGIASKIKAAHQEYIPNKVVIGQKEVNANFVGFKSMVDRLVEEIKDKPFIPIEWPVEVSRRL